MNQRIINHDIDGQFIQLPTSPFQYQKKLSLQRAYYIDRPEDLQFCQEQLVREVEVKFNDHQLLIHYQSSIEPLDLFRLRSLVALPRPFSNWRLTRLAIDICQHLQELHKNDLPQMVIHPSRIGRMDNRFVLLPTLSGIMPPFKQLKDHGQDQWIHFIAPEILRTRGKDESMLQHGDIYSLGMTLRAIAADTWQPNEIDNTLEFAAGIVENLGHRDLEREPWPETFHLLSPVIQGMCRPFPEDRPSPDDLLDQLKEVENQCSPGILIPKLIARRQLEAAAAHLAVLKDKSFSPLFEFPPLHRYQLEASYFLAQPEPRYDRAIAELVNASHLAPGDAGIYRQIARAYSRFTNHSQHLQLSADAYEKAARLSNWQGDIVSELLEVLPRVEQPATVLRITTGMPWAMRTPELYKLRIKSAVHQGECWTAWNEAVYFFEKFGFDQSLYILAKKAASFIDPLELLEWKYAMEDKKNIPGVILAFSIVWERNGNVAYAKRDFNIAKQLLSTTAQNGGIDQ